MTQGALNQEKYSCIPAIVFNALWAMTCPSEIPRPRRIHRIKVQDMSVASSRVVETRESRAVGIDETPNVRIQPLPTHHKIADFCIIPSHKLKYIARLEIMISHDAHIFPELQALLSKCVPLLQSSALET